MIDSILGHYRIEAKLGEGAFAIVYKAHDIRLNRTVAVKILREKHLQFGTAWGRLLREAQIASVLNHPNICALYDIGEEYDTNYIVLEFIEGQTLRAILESGALPVKTVFQHGIQIAEAMAYAQAVGVLHRDLKSSNIMVTPSGRIKIVDFGLAKFVEEERSNQCKGSQSSLQELEWLAGTLPYMAPELLHGEKATRQSGVWSLGVVLFEMLTGRLPFTGRTPFELSMAIMVGKIEQFPRESSASIRGIIQRCLMADKGSRYQSALEALHHLQAEFASFEVGVAVSNRRSLWARPHRTKLLAFLLNWLTTL